jgi:hypothetical protein
VSGVTEHGHEQFTLDCPIVEHEDRAHRPPTFIS